MLSGLNGAARQLRKPIWYIRSRQHPHVPALQLGPHAGANPTFPSRGTPCVRFGLDSGLPPRGAASLDIANPAHLRVQSDLPQSFASTKPLSWKSSRVTPPRLRNAHTHLAKSCPILRLRLI